MTLRERLRTATTAFASARDRASLPSVPTARREDRGDGIRDAASRLRARLRRHRRRLDPRAWPPWVLGVLLVAVPSQALGVWRVFGDLPAGSRPPTLDSVIFEYVGWYLTVGGRLYLDVWELKPPLAYELTAALSLLAGGDPVVAHGLAVGTSVAAAVGTALLAGALVRDLTGDEVAAFAAGVSLYVLPAFHWRAAYGFKVKYVVPLLALGALYAARRDRPGTAGALAGAAAGTWQLAVVVPAMVVGLAHQRGERPAAVRATAGAAAVLGLSVLPVVYWGAVEAMVTETLLVPLLVREGSSVVDQARLASRSFGGALPVAILGAVGVAVAARRRPRATWWLAAGTAWFGLMAAFVDLDGPPDLFPLMAFLAVGLGLFLGTESGEARPAAVLVAILAVVAVVTGGGFGFATSPLPDPDPLQYDPGREVQLPYSPTDRRHLFWQSSPPATCRVFFGTTQLRLVRLTGQGYEQRVCGDAGPVVDALLDRGLGGTRDGSSAAAPV